jgi:hypothetical protein
MKNWEELTRQERKVALAEDVLKRLAEESLHTRTETGIIAPEILGDHRLIKHHSENISDYVSQESCSMMRSQCTVCAKGALLLSRIDKFNHIRWNQIAEGTPYDVNYIVLDATNPRAEKLLSDAFSAKELALIEAAFECSKEYIERIVPVLLAETIEIREKFADAERFGKSHQDDNDRLYAIMSNIVDNEGDFKPWEVFCEQ